MITKFLIGCFSGSNGIGQESKNTVSSNQIHFLLLLGQTIASDFTFQKLWKQRGDFNITLKISKKNLFFYVYEEVEEKVIHLNDERHM